MKLRRIIRRIISISICALITLSLTACNPPETSQYEPLKSEDVSVCVIPSTEKVFQDVSVSKFSEYAEDEISLIMALGEYESANVIITPEKNVKDFKVVKSDLIHENGVDVFSKDNIAIYLQKYVELSYVTTGIDMDVGMLPDAIIPFDTAVKYGENIVKAGENQGIYVTFNTRPKEVVTGDVAEYEYIAPGTYTGKITVTFDTFEKIVPVSIEVKNITVPEKSNYKSLMLHTWYYGSGELDHSQESLDKYSEKLIEYRLGPCFLVSDNPFRDEDVEFYTEKAYEYLSDPRCPSISIGCSGTYYSFYNNEGEPTTKIIMSQRLLSNYISHFVEKSYTENFDMFERSTLYNTLIDEPKAHGLYDITKYSCEAFNETVKAIADYLDGTNEDEEYLKYVVNGEKYRTQIVNGEIKNLTPLTDDSIVNRLRRCKEELNCSEKEKIIDSLRNFQNVVTCEYDEAYAGFVNTFCPNIYTINSFEQFGSYTQDELWWYNNSKGNGPTVWLDTYLYSLRSMFWMMGQYDIKGYLNWCVNTYTLTGYQPMEDYYGSAVHFSSIPGEGYLFYPGAQYGLDEPVASLRLEAMRDGLEEAEIMHFIREKYEEISADSGVSFTAQKSLDALGANLYVDLSVKATTGTFASTRESLYQLAECLSSPAQMCITDFTEDVYGKSIYKVYMKDGYALKNNGQILTDYETVTGGRIYTITNELSNDVNTMNLSFECDGTEYNYTQRLGGKVIIYKANDIVGSFKKGNVSATEELVAVEGFTDKVLKVTVGKPSEGSTATSQRISLQGSVVQGLDAKASKLVLRLYNPNDTAYKIRLSAKIVGSDTAIDLGEAIVSQGEGKIELNLVSLSLETRRLSNINLIIREADGAGLDEKVLYFTDFVVCNK